MGALQEFKFKDLTPEEKEARGILGRLYGPCASISIPTRNGRLYSEKLWEKVFGEKGSITEEMFKNGGIPMELDHPTDREETCSDRIAAMLPEPPVKDKDGHLICYVDLIDTPCGKIAYQLAKYGFNLGISSRGSGDVIENFNGQEEVDSDTYNFQTFDLVLLPAVKDARLKLMTESYQGKTLNEALKETLDKASETDRKIMQETLKDLDIGYSDSMESSNIQSNVINDVAAKDTGAELLKTLQSTLLAKENEIAKVTKLQEKLSVSYAKEAELQEELSKYKTLSKTLTEQVQKLTALKDKAKVLQEELSKKDDLIQEERESKKALQKILESYKTNKVTLTEDLSTKQKQITDANLKMEALTKKHSLTEGMLKKQNLALTEKFETLKKDYAQKQVQYSKRLDKANVIIEQYRDKAQQAVDKYIESKAISLGLHSQEIKNKLPNNYSFVDIDTICESLCEMSLNVNALPFTLNEVKSTSITGTKKIPGIENLVPQDDADDVDEDLIRLVQNMSN